MGLKTCVNTASHIVLLNFSWHFLASVCYTWFLTIPCRPDPALWLSTNLLLFTPSHSVLLTPTPSHIASRCPSLLYFASFCPTLSLFASVCPTLSHPPLISFTLSLFVSFCFNHRHSVSYWFNLYVSLSFFTTLPQLADLCLSLSHNIQLFLCLLYTISHNVIPLHCVERCYSWAQSVALGASAVWLLPFYCLKCHHSELFIRLSAQSIFNKQVSQYKYRAIPKGLR